LTKTSQLKEKYFDRINNINLIITDINKATIDENNKESLFNAISLKTQQQMLLSNKDNLQRQFEINFPEPSHLTLTNNGGTGRYHVVATILFFIIGLFISIVIEQLFRKTA